MADNIAKRIIQLILDKASATKVESDIKGVGHNVENAWKATAAKIAGFLGFAFLTKKVVDFGKAAVDEAMAANDAWNELRGTIDNTGESFDNLEESVRAMADAFQDATIHDDDAFAVSLTRLITLTDDVDASINNMGLVANVAAKFFKGDLAPATDLVAKAMNGNTMMLKRMGIEAGTAQEALEILAQRSMGAAEREAATLSGQLKQLNVLWGNFQEAVGNAIIKSDGATTGIEVLRNAITRLTEWVGENQEAISQWVTKAINFAIDATDVLLRAIIGTSNAIAGGFMTSLGLAARGLAFMAKGYALAQTAGDKFFAMLGNETAKKNLELGDKIMEQADAIDAWGKSVAELGTARVEKGIDILSTPLFSSEQFQESFRKKPKLDVNKPMIGSDREEAQRLRETAELMDQLSLAQDRLAESGVQTAQKYSFMSAAIDRVNTLLGKVPATLKPVNVGIVDLTGNTQAANDAMYTFASVLENDLAFAAIEGADKLEMLRMEQNALQKAIKSLIALGIDPQDERLRRLAERYREVTAAIDQQTFAMEAQAMTAEFLAEVLGAAMQGGISVAAGKKAQQNKLEAAEMLIRAGVFALFGDFGRAGASLKLAASHAALAVAWGGLAAATKGSGGGATAPAFSGGGSGGSDAGRDLTTSRDTTRESARNATTPSSEVSIYLVGPGFDALNPAVQRVVHGAQQEAAKAYGPNARIRVRSTGRS